MYVYGPSCKFRILEIKLSNRVTVEWNDKLVTPSNGVDSITQKLVSFIEIKKKGNRISIKNSQARI